MSTKGSIHAARNVLSLSLSLFGYANQSELAHLAVAPLLPTAEWFILQAQFV